MDKEESFGNSTCEDQVNMAERELSAFMLAVPELFGPEQAGLSAEDWLDESEQMDSPQRATSRDWRAVTVAALARLATGGTPARDDRTLAASTDTKGSPLLSSSSVTSAFLVWCVIAADAWPAFRSGTPVEIEAIFEVLSMRRTKDKAICHTITPVPTSASLTGMPASILLTCMHSPSRKILSNGS